MMQQVHFRFYEELNDFLPVENRKIWFVENIETGTTIRTILQKLGVPIKEVDLILVNQQSQGLDYQLHNDDRVSVYPMFELFDISSVSKVHDKPLRNLKFIGDVHLGRLCKYLRMLGFDTLYFKNYSVDQLIDLSRQGRRILLSKDQKLAKHPKVNHWYWIRSSDPLEQIRDLYEKLDLASNIEPLIRCIKCNNEIISVPKKEILGKLQPRTAKYYQEFFQCPDCERIYWKGSHYEHMMEFIENNFQQKNSSVKT